jgi:MraZ protein
MYRGNQPAKVDAAGRLKLPEKFRGTVLEIYGPEFYVTSKDGEQAELWPLKEWEKIEVALANTPSSKAKKRLLDATSYYGQEVEMDAQGRLLLPQLLREKAGLKGDVAVMWQETKFVVIPDGRAREKVEANPVTGDDLDALGIPGL